MVRAPVLGIALCVAGSDATAALVRPGVCTRPWCAQCSRVQCTRIMLATETTPDVPLSAVGVDGGDVWSGQRVSKEMLAETVDEACSTTNLSPVVAQYYPNRFWLWRQWYGTVIRRTLPREVLYNFVLSVVVVLLFSPSGPLGVKWVAIEGYLVGLERAWTLSATMASFLLSFFLSQSYSLWRSVYSIMRRVQGRLNDFSLLCATFAERDRPTGRYTEEAEALLSTISRYVRLFHMLFYASATTRFAPLKTPKGLSSLVEAGALTSEERDILLESSIDSSAIVGWLSVLVDTAVADGRLGVSVARKSSAAPIAVQIQLQNKLVDLRSTYASLQDELTARMPLAYVQLVQVLTDGLVLFTPLALVHTVGPFGVICGTLVVTLFYSSVVTLAKLFLDPLNNEVSQRGGDPGIGGIDVATLLTATNIESERWRRSAARVPDVVWRSSAPVAAEDDAKEKAEPKAEPSLIQRLMGAVVPMPLEVTHEQPEPKDRQSTSRGAGGGGSADDELAEATDAGFAPL